MESKKYLRYTSILFIFALCGFGLIAYATITVPFPDPSWNGPNNGGSDSVSVGLSNDFSDYSCPPQPAPPPPPCTPSPCTGGPTPSPAIPPPPPAQGPVSNSF